MKWGHEQKCQPRCPNFERNEQRYDGRWETNTGKGIN